MTQTPDSKPIVEFHGVSKWYGNVIGINKLTLRVPAGVTGLLGPNGAGKSTFLQLATGQLFASQGQVRVLGQAVWNNSTINRQIGLCPEQDAFYEWMTGWDFVYTSARLAGLNRSTAKDAAARTIEAVGMTRHQGRAVRGDFALNVHAARGVHNTVTDLDAEANAGTAGAAGRHDLHGPAAVEIAAHGGRTGGSKCHGAKG